KEFVMVASEVIADKIIAIWQHASIPTIPKTRVVVKTQNFLKKVLDSKFFRLGKQANTETYKKEAQSVYNGIFDICPCSCPRTGTPREMNLKCGGLFRRKN
ncbi:hypothetical protein Ciccas_013890, partial [Cichlidogyrus casuarinus]